MIQSDLITNADELAEFIREACDHLETEPLEFFFVSFSRVDPEADAAIATNLDDEELAHLLAGLSGGIMARLQEEYENRLN